MGWYRVQSPPRTRTSIVWLAAGSIVALALVVACFQLFGRVAVTLDGRRLLIRSGSTVAEAMRANRAPLPNGDLIGAVSGTVVGRGRGGAATVRVNGDPGSLGSTLFAHDFVVTERGRDTTEPIVVKREGIEIPVRVEGAGPLVRIVQPGAKGIAEIRVGAVSGQVVSRRVVTPALPMVYRHMTPRIRRGKLIALTFDDGPWPGQTERILQALKAEHVHATFFMIGSRVRSAPALARRVLAEGHVIGNHTEHHLQLGDQPFAVSLREITAAQSDIKNATGITPTWFRPPGGSVSRDVYRASAKLHLQLAMWNIDPRDWSRPGHQVILARVVGAAKPGGVVVMHDGGGDRNQTIWVLRKIIRGLRAKGYTFVTLDQMPGKSWR